MTLTSPSPFDDPRWATAAAADGPRVVAWLEARGLVERLSVVNDSYARRVYSWRTGGIADYGALDRLLVAIGLHVSDLPDEVWLDAKRRPKAERQAAVEAAQA